MKLQPNQKIIVDLLSDGKFHCPTKELFMKDDRARIAALRKLGFVFDSPRCNMGHDHSSGVVMRRLIDFPGKTWDTAIEDLSGYYPIPSESPQKPNSAPVAPLTPEKVINPIQPLFVHSSILD